MSFSRAESALQFRAHSLDGDLARKRLRERYIAIQFPDYLAVRDDSSSVIRLARELHDDGERRLASEVLILATQDHPQDKSFVLALLELAYLSDDAELFCAVATYFRDTFPKALENNVINTLGRHIAPRHAAFVSSGKSTQGSPYTIPGWSQTGALRNDAEAHAEFRQFLLSMRLAGQSG